MRSRRHAAGFTYLGVLFLLVVLGLTAAMAGVVWSHAQQREDERQLEFVGHQFQLAIDRYAKRTKEPQPRFPRRVEDLLRDPRAMGTERDLRRIYVDPMTGQSEWGWIRLADGSLVGVHSLSKRQPLRDVVPGAAAASGPMSSYRDWRYIAPSARLLMDAAAQPDGAASAAAPGPAASTPRPAGQVRRS
jgi:type II secretory pathway pseudopilin PulG